jgi:hypothetical protein
MRQALRSIVGLATSCVEAFPRRHCRSPPRPESNQVLAKVASGLETVGYTVEKTGAMLPLTVLWGTNGRPDKSFSADAKMEHAQGRETVIEVEADRLQLPLLGILVIGY